MKKEIEQPELHATKRTDIYSVDPRNIFVVEGFNVRQDMGDLETLAESIRTIGLQMPLKAKKIPGTDTFELVEGHRRLAAVMMLIEKGVEIKYVEVQPFKGNEEDKIFTMFATGVTQKALTEVEQAEAIKRLVAYNYEVKEIASKIGKSLQHIYNLLTLANMPKAAKDMVSAGLISGSTAVAIAKEVKGDDTKQVEVIKEAVDKAQAQGKKKATASSVNTLKAKSPMQKLYELSDYLAEKGENNEKTELFLTLMGSIKTASIKELAKLFK